ncbi:hypothetical protein XA68_10319 [Ophiocordyceps unilateralis]|uniref:Uncharacterized protein n=1 Tax=Ophiocordyceps unilateralis TaxID=268505 RepID=A0A2A9PH38_OPHUN|nr:hypothetical protein XA68_10319 [Ophiocordyceps unilateralis]
MALVFPHRDTTCGRHPRWTLSRACALLRDIHATAREDELRNSGVPRLQAHIKLWLQSADLEISLVEPVA